MEKDKGKMKPLTDETIIGSRKIAKTELRNYFKEALGADYEKHAVIMDILKNSFIYKGRTLKEIIEECFNPSWYEKMDESVTSFQVQKETKAKIEDVIPHYLVGNMLKAALDFAAYLQSQKMQLKWDAWNKWKVFYKNKTLCWISLNLFVRPVAWIVSPCLSNINEYEAQVLGEGWQDFITDGFRRCCSPFCAYPEKDCNRGRSVTILGKEFYDICREVFEVNNKRADFVNPDETAISRIKKLLELERATRMENGSHDLS